MHLVQFDCSRRLDIADRLLGWDHRELRFGGFCSCEDLHLYGNHLVLLFLVDLSLDELPVLPYAKQVFKLLLKTRNGSKGAPLVLVVRVVQRDAAQGL